MIYMWKNMQYGDGIVIIGSTTIRTSGKKRKIILTYVPPH